MLIKVAALDPSLSNLGIARFTLDLDGLTFGTPELTLIETTRQVTKIIRANSDDLRRASELQAGLRLGVAGCTVAFAEIPSGAQSARGAFSNGIAIATIASCPIAVIQVMPSETKLATVGTKTASKEEMIEWAAETYPDANWLRVRRKGNLELVAKNEHLADACAIAHAGIKTEEFRRLVAVWKAPVIAA